MNSSRIGVIEDADQKSCLEIVHEVIEENRDGVIRLGAEKPAQDLKDNSGDTDSA